MGTSTMLPSVRDRWHLSAVFPSAICQLAFKQHLNVLQDKVRYEQEVYPRTPYGPDIRGVRSNVLQADLTNWVVKSRGTHDDEVWI